MYKIMLVDDEPSVIESVRRMLFSNSNFEVVCECYMVSNAKILIDNHQPDIIFTDIKMPKESGIELIKYIGQFCPQCVVVVLSGYDNFDFVRDAFFYGVEDYLLKPVEPSAFNSFMDGLLLKLENRQKLCESTALTTDNSLSKKSTFALRPMEKLLHDIESYIDANIDKDNSIDSICKAFAISQPYLSKAFRKYKNCSYNEFLIATRIDKAKGMLSQRQDLLIGTIASLCGFSDQFYFSKVFKATVGFTPSEYRKS